jgi:hypothetical protein
MAGEHGHSWRFLYNRALEQRRGQRIGPFKQMRQRTDEREAFPEYKAECFPERNQETQ